MKVQVRSDLSGFRARIREAVADRREKLRAGLAIAGTEVVNHIKSHTGETKPGVRVGDGPRVKHPGGWADITSNLVNSITAEVLPSRPQTETLVISAGMEYAAALEAKEGYTVLAGSAEAARDILGEVMP